MLKRAKIDSKAPQNHPRKKPKSIYSINLQLPDPLAEKRDCETVKLCNRFPNREAGKLHPLAIGSDGRRACIRSSCGNAEGIP